MIVTDTFNMAVHTHRSFVTASSYPAIVGKHGTIEINATSSNISVLALRFSPSAVSAVPPLVSSYGAVSNTAYYWEY